MRKDINPAYHEDAVITCACGASYKTGSTTKTLAIEICSACHPFYTGKKKYVDTTGRVERFKALTEKSVKKQETRRKASAKKDSLKAKEEKKETKKKPGAE